MFNIENLFFVFSKVHKSSEFLLLSMNQISKFFQGSNLKVQEKDVMYFLNYFVLYFVKEEILVLNF